MNFLVEKGILFTGNICLSTEIFCDDFTPTQYQHHPYRTEKNRGACHGIWASPLSLSGMPGELVEQTVV